MDEMTLPYEEVKELCLNGKTEKFSLVNRKFLSKFKGKSHYEVIFSDVSGTYWGVGYDIAKPTRAEPQSFFSDGYCVKMVPHVVYRRYDERSAPY